LRIVVVVVEVEGATVVEVDVTVVVVVVVVVVDELVVVESAADMLAGMIEVPVRTRMIAPVATMPRRDEVSFSIKASLDPIASASNRERADTSQRRSMNRVALGRGSVEESVRLPRFRPCTAVLSLRIGGTIRQWQLFRRLGILACT
jgi:hypothetical protein